MALSPGDVVRGLRGEYRVEAMRGQGSFGVTFRATDASGARVIVKELHVEKLHDWKALELFEREGETLAALTHPNIPAFRDFFAHGAPTPLPVSAMSRYEGTARLSLVLVQEFIEGSTLQELVDRGQPIAPAEAERILRELLGALQYLHGREPPLVHRDIKSGNVILTPDRRPYLVDFGAVQTRLHTGESVGSTIVGTLGYMPLEQVRGQAVPASDLYALAMTLVVALGGRPPEQLVVDESTGKVALGRALPRGTPEPLVDALDGMLEVLTGRRVRSADEVLARLDGAHRAPPPAATRRPSSTASTAAIVAGALLFAVVVPELIGLLAGHDFFGLSRRRASQTDASSSAKVKAAAPPPSAAPRAPTGPPAPFQTAPSYVGQLPNGLTVLVLEDHDPPVVAVRLVYRAAGALAPDGVQILAPRVVLDSTEHIATGQYEALLGAAGARGTTWATRLDDIAFATTVPTSRIDLPLWAYSDQMTFAAPRVDEESVRRARDVAVQDSRMRYDDVGCAAAEEVARDTLYPEGHPYHHAPARVPAIADGIDSTRVRAYLKSVFVPARAALVLVGDVTAASAMTRAARWFGDFPSGKRDDPTPPEGLPTAEVHVAMKANVDHPQVRIVWRIPRATDDPIVWRTLAQLLDGGETRAIAWDLVDRQKIASRVSASYSPRAYGSIFAIEGTLEPGHSAADLVNGVDTLLHAWIRNATRLSWAVRQTERSRLMNSETTADRASWLATDWIQWGKSRADWTVPTQTSVLQAVDAALVPAHRLIVDCEPDRTAPIAGLVEPKGS